MKLITAGSIEWPCPLSANERDWRVLQNLRRDWEDIHVIVKTRVGARQWSGAGVACDYLPNTRLGAAGPILFVFRATAAAFRSHRRSPAALFAASDPLSGVAGWGTRLLTGVPLLLHVQGELINPPGTYGRWYRRRVIGLVTRWLVRHADAVRAVHAGQVPQLVGAGARPERIRVVGSRCDTTVFERGRWRVEGERIRQAEAGNAPFVAVYVGSLLKGKGVQVALQAWRDAGDALAGARLVIVGDGPYRSTLERLAADLELTSSVRFVGAKRFNEVPAYLAAADAFVFPSFSEASPRAVIEAMSMGLPLVASRVGGVPDLVGHGRTGLLVEAGDVAALSHALVKLRTDTALRARFGTAGRIEACRRFDFETVIEQFRDLYRQAAKFTPAGG